MYDKLLVLFKLKTVRPHQLMVAFVVVFFVTYYLVGHSTPPQTVELSQTTTVIENDISQPLLTKSLPLQIRIPKLNITADFEEPLGVTKTREVEVPEEYDTVGYYKYGPTPGELGPAVVLGHVDSIDGPAVFYSLGQLELGDEIEIDREDGTKAVFEVTNMERHLQSGFPTEQVYGNIDYAGLRLITCSGTFDKGIQRYSHNLIVFAKLKGE